MNTLAKIIRADRCQMILELLAAQPNGALTEPLLREGLDLVGHRMAGQTLRALCHWLEGQELVQTSALPSGRLEITILENGRDVAEKRIQWPGIGKSS